MRPDGIHILTVVGVSGLRRNGAKKQKLMNHNHGSRKKPPMNNDLDTRSCPRLLPRMSIGASMCNTANWCWLRGGRRVAMNDKRE
jgi:hypothetical protein